MGIFGMNCSLSALHSKFTEITDMGDEGDENEVQVGGGWDKAGLGDNDQSTAVTVKVGKRKTKDGSKMVSKKKVKSEKTPTLIPVLDEDVFDNPEDEPGSIEKAQEAFQWLIGPTNLDTFYKEFWDFYNNGCSVRMLNPQT